MQMLGGLNQSVFASLSILAISLVLFCWAKLFSVSLRSHVRTAILGETRSFCTLSRRSPLVSIIVPARNEEAKIGQCLRSLLNQTYPNFEVIAVDDNSTDRTLEIMRKIRNEPAGTRLKVVHISSKPQEWSGKTYASEQGYLRSKGDILLFTDADSKFETPTTLSTAVAEMVDSRLDVLTAVPFLPLLDFWSKVVMPVWNLYSEVFGKGIADANDPASNVAFIMGCFFMVKRSVFEGIGTFEAVKDEIQEDRAIGVRLKSSGYVMRMVRADPLASALWSRDANTLWHGIRRTLAPAMMERWQPVLGQLAVIFVLVVVPFLMLPYSVLQGCNFQLPFLGGTTEGFSQLTLPSAGMWLNIALCMTVMVAAGVKSVYKYRLIPCYGLLSPLGGAFLVVAYARMLLPLLLGSSVTSIPWRGRAHQIAFG